MSQSPFDPGPDNDESSAEIQLTEEQEQWRFYAVTATLLGFLATFLPAALAGSYLYAAGIAITVPLCVLAYKGPAIMYRRAGIYGALLTTVVVSAAFWFPKWHSVYMIVVIKNPTVVLMVGLAVVFGAIKLGLGRLSTDDDASSGNVHLALSALIVLSAVPGPVAGGVAGATCSSEIMADQVLSEVETVEEVPETSANRTRITPLETAKERGEGSLQYPRSKLAGRDITYIDGYPHMSTSLSPDGTVNKFTQNQRGAVYVNLSTSSQDINTIDNANMKYGEGMSLTDNYHWQLVRDDPGHSYRDPFNVPHNGSNYIAVPYVDYEWNVSMKGPGICAVPEFGGVKLIAEDGEITDLSPSEARESEVLKGQNFYPYQLSQFRVKSVSYQHGTINTLINHTDQLEISSLPGDNTQPFTLQNESGHPVYMTATEPFGSGGGVYQLYIQDGRSSDIKRVEYDRNSSVRGASKAVQKVSGHPTVDRLQNSRISEVMPAPHNGTLYWEMRVISSGNTINYMAYFDATDESIHLIDLQGADGDAQVRGFVEAGPSAIESDADQERGNQSGGGSAAGGASDSDAIVVTIEYDDGSTEDITVPDGGSVTISSEDSTNNSNNSTSN